MSATVTSALLCIWRCGDHDSVDNLALKAVQHAWQVTLAAYGMRAESNVRGVH